MSYQPKENSKELNGIYGFFRNRNHSKRIINLNEERINKVVKEYCKKEHDFEGSLNDCAKLIQDNFNDFVSYATHNV